jgi:hypothetical protein
MPLLLLDFMKNDLQMFFNQIDDHFADSCYKLGILIICVSFVESMSIFFLLVVINKFRRIHRYNNVADPNYIEQGQLNIYLISHNN